MKRTDSPDWRESMKAQKEELTRMRQGLEDEKSRLEREQFGLWEEQAKHGEVVRRLVAKIKSFERENTELCSLANFLADTSEHFDKAKGFLGSELAQMANQKTKKVRRATEISVQPNGIRRQDSTEEEEALE
jgi:hypothetical protein